MVRKCLSVALTVFLWGVSVDGAQGYEAMEVQNGAILKGTVNIQGSVPTDEKIKLDKDVDYCGSEQELGRYIVSHSHTKNAVVWIEGVERGRALPDRPVRITLERCKAEPLVSVGFVGGKFLFKNEDDIFHTLQLKLGLAYQKKVSSRPLEYGATIYNLALPIKGLQIEKPIRSYYRYSEETGFIQVLSNTHTWIRGYIFIFDHPYAAVTDENGRFSMEGLPPGDYVLKIWHEGLGIEQKRIHVKAGEVKDVEINLAGPGHVSVRQRGGWTGTVAEAAELNASPSIDLEETRFDFGLVPEGEVVSHAFHFVNRGKELLKIKELIPS